MSLLVNEAYQPQQVLELKMLLFPSLTGVLMYATVVDCVPLEAADEGDGYTYRLRLAFTHLR